MSKVSSGTKWVGQIYSLGQEMGIILFYRNADNIIYRNADSLIVHAI